MVSSSSGILRKVGGFQKKRRLGEAEWRRGEAAGCGGGGAQGDTTSPCELWWNPWEAKP